MNVFAEENFRNKNWCWIAKYYCTWKYCTSAPRS